jgi:hypothetical protein
MATRPHVLGRTFGGWRVWQRKFFISCQTRKSMKKGSETGYNLQRNVPSDPLSLVRSHLSKLPPLPKLVSPTGNQKCNQRTF